MSGKVRLLPRRPRDRDSVQEGWKGIWALDKVNQMNMVWQLHGSLVNKLGDTMPNGVEGPSSAERPAVSTASDHRVRDILGKP